MNTKSLSGGKLAGGNPSRGRALQDYYATHPDSTRALLEVEEIIYPVWEPACGEGHISRLLTGNPIISTDLIERGYGKKFDFLNDGIITLDNKTGIETIITNPPFSLFQEFAEKALKVANKKVIMFGKLQALEGQKRATFMQNSPLKTVYVFKSRQQPLRNGSDIDELTGKKMNSSTMAFAWFIWEIGYEGEPIIKWLS